MGRSILKIEKKNIPLSIQQSNEALWTGLPLKYGYIEYINKEKKILHIITQDAKQTFAHYNENTFAIGDIVRFYEYTLKKEDKEVVSITQLAKAKKDTAIVHFPSAVVVVDHINEEKQLFHFAQILSEGNIDGLIRFENTNINPQKGRMPDITYTISRNKKVEKRTVVL